VPSASGGATSSNPLGETKWGNANPLETRLRHQQAIWLAPCSGSATRFTPSDACDQAPPSRRDSCVRGLPSLVAEPPAGKRRRLLLVRAGLHAAKQAAQAHGARVDDIVLAAVAGGARELLRNRGELAPGLRLRAGIPVSMRGAGDPGASGNRVG
jgi:hypothetical protein